MGGSDDASNLIELSIEDHAEAHRVLFETYGKPEDELAWRALSGQLNLDEITKEAILIGASNGGKVAVASGQIHTARELAMAKLKALDYMPVRLAASKTGKQHAESGHLDRIRSKEASSRGGKAAVKRSNRYVTSQEDGYTTTMASRYHHEKRTGFKHTWIDNDKV
jgi:hypothetical protein